MAQQAPAGVPASKGSSGGALGWASRNARLLAPLLTLVVMVIFFSVVTDVFLTVPNLQNVVTQIAPIAVAATGVTFVLLCAEIDLSIASVSTLTGVLAAWLFVGETVSTDTWRFPIALLAAGVVALAVWLLTESDSGGNAGRFAIPVATGVAAGVVSWFLLASMGPLTAPISAIIALVVLIAVAIFTNKGDASYSSGIVLPLLIGVLAGMVIWFILSNLASLGSWGILVAVLVAVLVGFVNGYFTAYVGIPSFMMTLAMLTIARGLSIFVSGGKPIFEVPPLLKSVGSVGNQVFGIPVIGLVALAVLLIGEFVLSYTKFGRYVYMTGANREAAEMSGVNTRQIVMMSLVISAVTAGLTGLLFIGRLSSANPSAGEDILISTIAAVVLGGTSLFGGEGGIRNTILGLLIFGVLSNGLNLLPNIPITFKQALQGIVLLAALLLNVFALRIERVKTKAE